MHKSPPSVPILIQINPILAQIEYLLTIFKLFTRLILGLPSSLIPWGWKTKILLTPILYTTRATCLNYLLFLHLVNSEAFYYLQNINVRTTWHLLLVLPVCPPVESICTYCTTPTVLHAAHCQWWCPHNLGFVLLMEQEFPRFLYLLRVCGNLVW